MIRPRTLVATLLLTSTPALAKGPPADSEVPESLISLRSQLFDAGEQKALKQMSQFRALCDAEGYPLVGNVVRKGDVYQPSAFCSAVRAKESRA